MSKEVLWFEVDSHVIVGQCTTEVIDVQSCEGSVDIVVDDFRAEVNGFAQTRFRRTPLFPVQRDIRARRPGIGIIRINVETA